MQRTKTVAAMLLAMWVLAACNTVSGVGKDVERGGEALQNASDRNKK